MKDVRLARGWKLSNEDLTSWSDADGSLWELGVSYIYC